MAISNKAFKAANITISSVLTMLSNGKFEKPEVIFPFDRSLDNRLAESILTKILFVNYRDSTQIKNKDVDRLTEHIKSVLSHGDLAVLYNGELNEQYFCIVDKIMSNHGITGTRNGKPTAENKLTSFASKFCGWHNQKAPFWDNQVFDLLRYLGFKHEYKNYRKYVEAIKTIQTENGLDAYSLREIEFAMWQITDSVRRNSKKIEEFISN